MNTLRILKNGFSIHDINNNISLKLPIIDDSPATINRVGNNLEITSRWQATSPNNLIFLRYTKIEIFKNNELAADVTLDTEAIIENCLGYQVTLRISTSHEVKEVGFLDVTYAPPEDSEISKKLLNGTLDPSDDYRYQSPSDRLMLKLLEITPQKSTNFSNMYELRRFSPGVLVSGERILTKDFKTYKFIPYPEKIKVPDGWKLYYAQWENTLYSYTVDGDKVKYYKYPRNKRSVDLPSQLTGEYTIPSPTETERLIFCGSGIIWNNLYIENGLTLKSPSGWRFENTELEKVTLVRDSVNGLAEMFYNTSDQMRYITYPTPDEFFGMTYISSRFNTVVVHSSTRGYCIFGWRGYQTDLTDKPEIISSDLYRYKGEIRCIHTGMIADESTYRFNYYRKITPGLDLVRVGRALYQKTDLMTYELI